MLNVMRDNLRHLKWLLWLVALSMVAYLGAFFSCDDSGGGRGAAAPWAAKVNGSVIPAQDLLNMARNMDGYYRQLFQDNFDQLKPQIRIGSQAVQTLIDQELMLQDAQRLGITATEEDIARQIQKSPTFQDATGQFIGRERYMQAVERNFGSASAYESSVANDIVIQKWTSAVTQSVVIDDSELEAEHRRRTEKTEIDFILIASSDQEIDTNLTDQEVQSWYDDNTEDYRRDKGRRIRYAVIDREAQAAHVQVTDEQIQASYNQNQVNYTHPAQRSARHILFSIAPGADDSEKAAVRSQAESVLARLQAGEDFATLAQSMSQDPGSAQRGGDLGYFGSGAMVPPFENAVFNTAVGELAPLTETQFGIHLIEVTGIREAGVTPLDQVAEEIRNTLEVQAAQDRVVSEAQRIRGLVGSAEGLANIATNEGLEVQSRFVTAGEQLLEIGAAPDFVTAVFDTEVGGVAPPLRLARGLAVVVVDEEVPAKIAPLVEVEDRVRTDLLNERLRLAAMDAASSAMAGRSDIGSIASALGKTVSSSGRLSPGQAPPIAGGSNAELEEALFGTATVAGEIGVTKVRSGALVYEVTAREGFDPTAFDEAREGLRAELVEKRRSAIRQGILERLRERHEITINDELVQRYNG